MPRSMLTTRGPERSKIDLADDAMAKYWARALGIGRQDLIRTVEKVGNSAAAVKKELETSPR